MDIFGRQLFSSSHIAELLWATQPLRDCPDRRVFLLFKYHDLVFLLCVSNHSIVNYLDLTVQVQNQLLKTNASALTHLLSRSFCLDPFKSILE